MVAGNPFLRSFNSSSLEQAAITYACLGSGQAQTNGFPNYNCPNGLRTQVFFPSCWDGKNLDSANHASHMAYPSGTDSGHCPASHPKHFISLFYEILWNTPDFANQVITTIAPLYVKFHANNNSLVVWQFSTIRLGYGRPYWLRFSW